MKKKILGILLASVLLAGCGGKGDYNRCVNHLKSHMKDPTSLIVNYATGYEHEGYTTFKINYNGKNSFGAYAGSSTIYVCIRPEGTIQCDHCEILSGDSQFYYTMGTIAGTLIYSE